MFTDFFLVLKQHGIPVTLKEHLMLLEALDRRVVEYSVDDFYALSRAIYVKHEKNLDRFDVLFGRYFQGINRLPVEKLVEIPAEWLQKGLENRHFTDEEKAAIEALGGLEKLMQRLQELLEKQKERHEGGDTWIGTQGTSPFGSDGFNPEGFRIGQPKGKQGQAVKVWEKREFKNLKDDIELDTRSMKVALKRLRLLTREGRPEELDIDTTIQKTSKNGGILDLEMVPLKKNKIKVLMLFDVGGTMDPYIRLCERLFSAAKYEFKHLEYYYFHNCLYEHVWKDNRRRFEEKIPTLELLNKYNKDYKLIFVGDGTMAPYEITAKHGSIEHYNEEAGAVWLQRMKTHYPYFVWLNPTLPRYWDFTPSISIVKEVMEARMFPLTLDGLTQAMRALKDTKRKYEETAE
ncbi:MAG: VWA domain-containing protein [Microscillaceae bacterium]|nr:VWA domain-containing protein [Microscillaceae bacterium]